jgi:hypothetical protein
MKIVGSDVVLEPDINIVKEYLTDTGYVFNNEKELEAVEKFAIWVVCKHIPLPE